MSLIVDAVCGGVNIELSAPLKIGGAAGGANQSFKRTGPSSLRALRDRAAGPAAQLVVAAIATTYSGGGKLLSFTLRMKAHSIHLY